MLSGTEQKLKSIPSKRKFKLIHGITTDFSFITIPRSFYGQDVMRCRVEQEEDIYTLFAAVNGIAVLPPNYDLEEEYYDKYRERLYASKLVLKAYTVSRLISPNLELLCCRVPRVILKITLLLRCKIPYSLLFFLDLAGEMRKKENKEEIRNRELFFTVMVSLSDSMIKQGCKHYGTW